MTWRSLGLLALLLASAAPGCSRESAQAAPSRDPPPAAPATAPPADRPGDQQDARWVPAEFQKGAARWKDTGVYVDGKPVGFLSFGELPLSLDPVWVDEEISIPVKAGQKGPAYGTVRQRYYRFTDYLGALGVDVARVRELHVYGPKFTDTIVVGGDELRKRGKDFLFRFGGDICGKAIPRVPDDFGNGKSPDKVSTVVVYITKKPPELVRNRGLVLDGELMTEIPYYGEPMRGGVRIYRDDRLAAVIKRRQLAAAESENQDAANPRWKLSEFFAQEGVDLGGVVEGWIVHRDKHVKRVSAEELATWTFEASSQKRGEIVIGPDKIPAHALSLHSRPVSARIPQPLPNEHCANASDN